MNTSLGAWAGFLALVLLMLLLDMRVLVSSDRQIGVRESLFLNLLYTCIALGFGAGVFYYIGTQSGKDFLTSYLIEENLSIDNIFAMSLVFEHFHIPRHYQRRVLVYGILGVILLRGIMIILGSVMIQRFHWILYIFGAFLVYSGVRMLYFSEAEDHNVEEDKLLIWLRKKIPVTKSLYGNKFFAYEKDEVSGNHLIRKATPLFFVLVFIELTDIVFAVDSVPAVFAITTDPFIVYTSNIFAILGLRALYFALAAMLHRFAYLKYALSLVLMFIGSKIFLVPFIGSVSALDSLLVTVVLLGSGVLWSLYKTQEQKK